LTRHEAVSFGFRCTFECSLVIPRRVHAGGGFLVTVNGDKPHPRLRAQVLARSLKGYVHAVDKRERQSAVRSAKCDSPMTVYGHDD
jgi:hypothetical protein